MGMTVQRRKDTKTPKVFMHKVADIRGGVSVATAELGSDYLPEGAVLSKPIEGVCHVVKTAEVIAAVGATGKTVTVKKGHQLKVGDFVLSALNGKATTVTAIDKSAKKGDTITIKDALGALAIGEFLVEAKAEQETEGAVLKYEPFALVGTGKTVIANDNINTDAWLIGVTSGNALPVFIANELKGIINY